LKALFFSFDLIAKNNRVGFELKKKSGKQIAGITGRFPTLF
jgi:hypothetical protein